MEDSNKDSIEDDPVQWSCKKIEIKGDVFLGWGLEPTTVGRFKMIEMEDDIDEEDEADDDDDDEISVDITLENIISLYKLSKMRTLVVMTDLIHLICLGHFNELVL